ncbi:hypothetical protein PRIC2_009435 [Phytophthora ramorum]
MASISPRGYAILESDHSQESSHAGLMATPSEKPRGRVPSIYDREIEIKYERIRNPCVLSWSDLSYTVKGKKTPELPWGTKTILDRVSGRCAPGELTAILGPSGSGKTTLVDLLADRISSGDVSGAIEVNGAERDPKTFRAVTSYVAQEDTLLGSFTVVETMRMAAKLSLPSTVTSQEIEYMNPAEFFISLVNTDFEDHAEVPKLIYAYAKGDVNKQIQAQIVRDRTTLKHLPDIRKRPPSALRQFGVLMYRNTLNNIRNPGIYWIRLFMYFCLSFMVGTMYLSTNNELTEEDLVPLLFYVQAFLVFMSVAVLPFFIEQRAVFARERANSSLSVVSYVCANFLATLPGIFVIAVMSTALVVLLAGLNAFEYFLLNLFLSLVVSESMMHVIGSAVPHYIIGIALGAGVFGMFMLCEGFMVPRASIPDYWIWGYYLAFHSYSFESFVFKQFENETSDAAKAILAKYGMEDVDVPRDMLLLVVYIAAFQAIFAFILWKFHTGRR